MDKYDQLKKNLKNYENTYKGLMSGTMGAARLAIIDLQEEITEYKKHATDFEDMYKQEHREKNKLKAEIEKLREIQRALVLTSFEGSKPNVNT